MSIRKIQVACCVASAALLFIGLMLVATCGFTPPAWLLRAEVATLSLLALAGGFSAALPLLRPLAAYLKLRAVRGTLLCLFAVASVYLPMPIIASAVFWYFGIRLVWAEACELAEPAPAFDDAAAVPETLDVSEAMPAGGVPMLAASSRELARRPSGQVVPAALGARTAAEGLCRPSTTPRPQHRFHGPLMRPQPHVEGYPDPGGPEER
jgi:hypothetical protein